MYALPTGPRAALDRSCFAHSLFLSRAGEDLEFCDRCDMWSIIDSHGYPDCACA
jgi:hypothetical protein